jgi:large subunit ribosomal protein L17
MRHRKGNAKLGLPTDQRMALIKNSAKALIQYKKIKMTTTRAKQVSRYVEKLITKAKKNDLHSRREVFRLIQDKSIVDIIFKDIINNYQNRNSGYTRILKYGIRRGDSASISVLELI